MKSLRIIVPASNLATKPTEVRRRVRGITAFALTSLASFGLITLDGCDNQAFGPTKGQVVGAVLGAVGVIGGTTAVLIVVHHKHHTVKGCVSSGPNGLQVESDDKNTYLLTGKTANIKTNSLLKLHGTKVRKPKHVASASTFEVEKVSKDYGPCKVSPVTTQSTADSKETFKAE